MNKRLEKTLIKANKHRKMHLIALNKILFKKRTKFFLFQLKILNLYSILINLFLILYNS